MNNQNYCTNYRESIAAFVLGILEPNETEKLQKHLETCQNCKSFYEAMLDEEDTLRSGFQEISKKGEVIQNSLIEKFDNNKIKTVNTPKAVKINWNKIIRSPLIKFAAAAIIIIAISLLFHNGSINITSVTLADIQKAVLAQKWMLIKSDNDDVNGFWYNLENGDNYVRSSEGRCVAVNYSLNTRHTYWPEIGEFIAIDRPATYKNDIIPAWEPKKALVIYSVWDLDKLPEETKTGNVEILKKEEIVGNTKLVRVDQYLTDEAGQRLLIKQLWIDPETRLPVKVRNRLPFGERFKQNREYSTSQYFYPENGPSDIYDLGVSKDLPIVNYIEQAPDPQVEKIFEAMKKAYDNFPKHYRVIVWQNKLSSDIEIIWRHDNKVRKSRYGGLPYSLINNGTAEEVFQFIQNQSPGTVKLNNDKDHFNYDAVSYSINNVDINSRRPLVQVYRDVRPELLSHWPDSSQWPIVKRGMWLFELIEDAPPELSDYIGLRREQGDTRWEYYLDPEHDYICVRDISSKLKSGKWENIWDDELSDFTTLPGGQFYARKRAALIGSYNWNIDVKVLGENEYPPDIFDGEELLKGADLIH